MMIMSLLRVGAEGILRQRNVKIFYKNTFDQNGCKPRVFSTNRGIGDCQKEQNTIGEANCADEGAR